MLRSLLQACHPIFACGTNGTAAIDHQESVNNDVVSFSRAFQNVWFTKESTQKTEEDLKSVAEPITTIHLILLGAAQSGKSTFFKQLQILHGSSFTTREERMWFRPVINENLLISLHMLVSKMPALQISLSGPGSEKDLEEFRAFVEHYKRSRQFNQVLMRQQIRQPQANNEFPNVRDTIEDTLPMSLGLSISQLWKDPGIQQVYGLAHQFQLNETAGYFLDNAKRICNADYIPTIKDILHARLMTVGASELKFNIRAYEFRVVDVGGQRSQRTKWLNHFDRVNGVIYIAALSGYTLVLEEDGTTNRMIESLRLFHTLTSSPIFAKTPFILFLNKTDIFKEKLKRYPLKMCFDQYTGPNKYEPAIHFIEGRFRAHFHRSRIQAKKARNFHEAPYLYKVRPTKEDQFTASDEKKSESERLYVHHTCATDTEQMQFVFNATADIILESTLCEVGLA